MFIITSTKNLNERKMKEKTTNSKNKYPIVMITYIIISVIFVFYKFYMGYWKIPTETFSSGMILMMLRLLLIVLPVIYFLAKDEVGFENIVGISCILILLSAIFLSATGTGEYLFC